MSNVEFEFSEKYYNFPIDFSTWIRTHFNLHCSMKFFFENLFSENSGPLFQADRQLPWVCCKIFFVSHPIPGYFAALRTRECETRGEVTRERLGHGTPTQRARGNFSLSTDREKQRKRERKRGKGEELYVRMKGSRETERGEDARGSYRLEVSAKKGGKRERTCKARVDWTDERPPGTQTQTPTPPPPSSSPVGAYYSSIYSWLESFWLYETLAEPRENLPPAILLKSPEEREGQRSLFSSHSCVSYRYAREPTERNDQWLLLAALAKCAKTLIRRDPASLLLDESLSQPDQDTWGKKSNDLGYCDKFKFWRKKACKVCMLCNI